MKKIYITRFLLIAIFLTPISACHAQIFSSENIFKRIAQVDAIPTSIQDLDCATELKGVNARVFACSFKMIPTDLANITSRFKLIEKIEEVTPLDKYNSRSLSRETIVSILFENSQTFTTLPWWKSLEDLEKMKVYGFYQAGEYDWDVQYIFIDENQQVYFLST